MEYTKKDLLRMKRDLYNLAVMEKRFNKFIAFLRIGTLTGLAGTAVSLSKFADKSFNSETAFSVGGSCLVVTGMLGGAWYLVNKEAQAVSDDLFELEMNSPDELVEEVYDEIRGRRR